MPFPVISLAATDIKRNTVAQAIVVLSYLTQKVTEADCRICHALRAGRRSRINEHIPSVGVGFSVPWINEGVAAQRADIVFAATVRALKHRVQRAHRVLTLVTILRGQVDVGECRLSIQVGHRNLG